MNCGNLSVGCEECTSSVDCTSCVSGFYWDTGACLSCLSLFPGCDLCSPTECFQCQTGYHLVSPNCVPCVDSLNNCLSCDDGLICTACDGSFYLDPFTNTCLSCTNITDCSLCSDNQTCTQCIAGFYLSASGCLSCKEVIEGCFSCVDESACLVCEGNYRLSNGQCTLLEGVSK